MHRSITACGMSAFLALVLLVLLSPQASNAEEVKTCKRVLVGHEYPPQRHLHGADTRLLQLLRTLAQECEEVHFVSHLQLLHEQCQEPWERQKETRDVQHVGAYVVDTSEYSGSPQHILRQIMQQLQPQRVMTTFWFWTFPLRPLWALQMLYAHQQTMMSEAYSSQFVVLSDDYHTDRERNLLRSMYERPSMGPLSEMEVGIHNISQYYTTTMLVPDNYKLWLLQPSTPRKQTVEMIERFVYSSADVVMTVTQEDAHRLSHDFVLSNVVAVPLELEIDTSNSGINELPVRQEKLRRYVCFVGNGRNPTNAIGVAWLLREVWPLVRERSKSFQHMAQKPQLRLIGEEPSGGWTDNTGDTSDIEVKGFAEDVSAAARECRLMVNPVQETSGFNTKNLVAFENLIPLVTTSAGASGLNLQQQEHTASDECDGLYIEDSPAGFAESVLQILAKEVQWHWMRRAQLAHVNRVQLNEAHRNGVRSVLAQTNRGTVAKWERLVLQPPVPGHCLSDTQWDEIVFSPPELLNRLLLVQSGAAAEGTICIRTQ